MYEIYTVLGQDTIDSIANNNDISVDLLKQINGIDSGYKLMPGNQLVVPSNKGQPYWYYTVKKGDNIYDIAKDNNIDYKVLLKLNGLEADDYIYPNQTIMLPKKGIKLYFTLENDTIDDILKKGNVSIDELIKDNEKIYLRDDQIIVFREK